MREDTQIDWAIEKFEQAAKASSDSDAALDLIARGLVHLSMEIKVIGYRISRLESEAGLPPLD